MREAGFFSLWLPKRMGGRELTLVELARIVEIFSRADGAVGWLVAICLSNSRLAGFLSEPIAREIWAAKRSRLRGH